MSAITRRFALASLLAAIPLAAFAARHRPGHAVAHDGGIAVDVSPLRRSGDNTDADYLAQMLPGYLRQSLGPDRAVRARIDSVVYGPPGSAGDANGDRAVDWIEGVAWIDGREVPLTASVQAVVYFPDIGGYGAHMRQDMLARSFAQWLPQQLGR